MAATVRLLLSDPDARIAETEHGLWAFSAVRAEAVRRRLADATDFEDVRDWLTEETEDAVVVHVSSTGNGGSIDAFRSVTGTRRLYFLRASDGTTVLTDNFRNALVQLDVEDREVRREAIADHLLFRAPIEPLTYVDRVRAVGHGEWVHWDDGSGRWETRLVDTLSTDGRTRPSEAPACIDEALSDQIATNAARDSRTMFSGGVDSTLLSTYGSDPRPFVMALDSPEFDFERSYAERGLELLDTFAERWVTVEESDFLRRLEESVDRLGCPSHYNQTVLTDAALAAGDGGHYVNGEGADALFGLTGTKACRLADWLDPLLSTRLADGLDTIAPGAVAGPYQALSGLSASLDRPIADPTSFANHLAFFTDHDAVSDVLSEDLVERRFQRQAHYVRRRAPVTDEEGFPMQVEFGHLLSFFRHNTVDQWRELGHVHDVTFFAPFKTRSLARCALSVPSPERYVGSAGSIRSLRTKRHLKTLLEDRLPAYDADKQKGSGALPIERFFEDGPLADAFERYAPPSFVTAEDRRENVEQYGPITWNLLTYAIWRDRVLREADLSLVPDTRRRHVRVASEPPAP